MGGCGPSGEGVVLRKWEGVILICSLAAIGCGSQGLAIMQNMAKGSISILSSVHQYNIGTLRYHTVQQYTHNTPKRGFVLHSLITHTMCCPLAGI